MKYTKIILLLSEPFAPDAVIIEVEGPRAMIVNWTLPSEAYPTGNLVVYTVTVVPVDNSDLTPSESVVLGEYISIGFIS